MIEEDVLCASKSEKEEGNGADEFSNDGDGMPTCSGRNFTKKSTHDSLCRDGNRCFGVHGGGSGRFMGDQGGEWREASEMQESEETDIEKKR